MAHSGGCRERILQSTALRERNAWQLCWQAGNPTEELFSNGALGRIRTSDRPVRSRVLYPAELRVREGGYYREAACYRQDETGLKAGPFA